MKKRQRLHCLAGVRLYGASEYGAGRRERIPLLGRALRSWRWHLPPPPFACARLHLHCFPDCFSDGGANVQLRKLLACANRDLKEMGVVKLAHRTAIMKAIALL